MANSFGYNFDGTKVGIPLKGTPAQLRTVIRRYAIQSNITVEGKTDGEIARAVLRRLMKIVLDGSVDRQRQDAISEQMATIEATIAADNDLLEPET
jgi:hypothetical protein